MDSSSQGVLSEAALHALDGFWRACNYLAAGMIYLRDNPLLQVPLRSEHIKQRLLGHWGSSPGISFVWTHLSRLIAEQDLNAILVVGPGHGAPGVLAPCWLEGSYGEVYRDKGHDLAGLRHFFKTFSFPGGIGSHCTPEMPGSMHEGGELGYSLSHAFGAAFDQPELLVTVVVGDGESETGPLATAWHGNKFLNPACDGAVLPILHLNGYKINNPTVLARVPEAELLQLFSGYGWRPIVVEGEEPHYMHQRMAAVMAECVADIQRIQYEARVGGATVRPIWPMIILRSPKGWTGPREVDGHAVAGTWRAHQVPLSGVRENPAHLAQLEAWLRSYAPESLFEPNGRPCAAIVDWLPRGNRRLGVNPCSNGGLLRTPLHLPDWAGYAVNMAVPGQYGAENTAPLGDLLRDILHLNPTNFRVFGPDETASNKLQATFTAGGKVWMGELRAEDNDGGFLSPQGRVMEVLSEHTLEGWLEGYLLTGRHGFLSTYEAFAHVIDSMVNQHAKWLDIAGKVHWRAPISSLNILVTSTVWRQDHNGFSHQDPGFIDVIANKSPHVVRIYLPPDANCLLAIAHNCLHSTNRINVIVADKQKHLQYLDARSAAAHCARGLGIWDWASNDDGEPDLIMAACGDVPTQEALAATQLLRRHFPALKVRFINVVDLFRLQPISVHPHGLTDQDFDSLFTPDRPVLFNFHGYPWLIHRLVYRRHSHANLHVRGYKERGNIDTPLELAIRNQIDRFSLVIDAIDLVPGLAVSGATVKQTMHDQQQACRDYAYEHGVDLPAESEWQWGSGDFRDV